MKSILYLLFGVLTIATGRIAISSSFRGPSLAITPK